ncbi:unnamed protein product [Strongylus vulgaris]|uniref:Uncharacterized protein n=1 Tax=Strongylus vulgaris TaxID=40348 RepID=A0A3P7KSH3_STRVU|nr:unnamed protein product [Strongylus vulgaris]
MSNIRTKGTATLLHASCKEGDPCNTCRFLKQFDVCATKNAREPHLSCHHGFKSAPMEAIWLFSITLAENAVMNMKMQGDTVEALVVHRSLEKCVPSTQTVNEGCSVAEEYVNACPILSQLKNIVGLLFVPEVNPGEPGCVDARQCDAVWPEATCSISGICECPENTVPSKTRSVVTAS